MKTITLNANWFLLLTPYKAETINGYYIPTLVSADCEQYIEYPTGGAAREETALNWAERTAAGLSAN